MSKTLVIVESPTKAKTISKFLGSKYTVESSFGHIRDLPKSKMGVDIEHGTFLPQYVVPKDKSKQVTLLKTKAKKSDTVIFATDEDREGEAISWHLAQTLGIDPKSAKRIVFHEITKKAIEHAIANPRGIDQKLVDAQQARRILDRLVGYELSPLLWKKIARGLSAGRVQSVAVRLVVERERERNAFIPTTYWSIEGDFYPPSTPDTLLHASLTTIDGKKLDTMALTDRARVDNILTDLNGAAYAVSEVEQKGARRSPPPPFTTSTLQQQANHKLGYSAKYAMRLAQELYETGHITYMRTDSVNLSETFLGDASKAIETLFGKKYLAESPRHFATKSKGAQEAHEAIRPTDPARAPESMNGELEGPQLKLYTLIWKRALATQMAEVELKKTIVDIAAKQYLFRANGVAIRFDGWSALYPDMFKEEAMPPLKANDLLSYKTMDAVEHVTEPSARYSDATLVKAMEEYGIGRPSTYAPTIATIEDRGYVERDDSKRLKPTDIGMLVNDMLVEHFPTIVDYQFTANLEKNLDEIAEGVKDWQPIIATFYRPFHETVEKKSDELSKKALTEEKTDEVCPKCANPMVIKMGRFGKFMACSNYPECKTTKPIGKEAEEAAEATNEICDKCGKPMVVKRGRFGSFLGCSGYPDCKGIKKIEKKTGVMCNKCGIGEFVEKRSKRGRTFYSCNRYPECENALWSKPTGELCPNCKSPLVFAAKGVVKCSNKECGYKNETKKETEN